MVPIPRQLYDMMDFSFFFSIFFPSLPSLPAIGQPRREGSLFFFSPGDNRRGNNKLSFFVFFFFPWRRGAFSSLFFRRSSLDGSYLRWLSRLTPSSFFTPFFLSFFPRAQPITGIPPTTPPFFPPRQQPGGTAERPEHQKSSAPSFFFPPPPFSPKVTRISSFVFPLFSPSPRIEVASCRQRW